MHGLIHVVLRSLVLEIGGNAAWASVLQRLGLDDDSEVLELRQHDDAVSVNAVQAAVATLDVALDDALRLFGAHFVKFLHETTSYIPTIRSYGADVLEFVHNIDHMHRQLQEVYTECAFPSFLVSGNPSTASASPAAPRGTHHASKVEPMRLSYASTRGTLLAPVAEGVLREVARFVYGQELVLVREATPREGYHVTWTVFVRDLENPAPAAAEMGAAANDELNGGKRSSLERRAGALWHSALASMMRKTSGREGGREGTQRSASYSAAVDDLIDFEHELHTLESGSGSNAAGSGRDRGPLGINSRSQSASTSGQRPCGDAECADEERNAALPINPRCTLRTCGRFQCPQTESLFQARVIARMYAHTTRSYAIAFCIVSLPFEICEAVYAPGCPAVIVTAATHAIVIVLASLCALACSRVLWALRPRPTDDDARSLAAAPSVTAALRTAERLALLWLSATSVQMVLLQPCRLALAAPQGRLDGHVEPPANPGDCAGALPIALPTCTQANALLALVGVLIVGSSGLPMSCTDFAVLAVVVVAGAIAAELGAPLPGHGRLEGLVEVTILAALALLLWRSSAVRMRRERRMFSAQLHLLGSTRRWQQLKKTEVEVHLRASSAEVASTARSKLIRVVMHDLRSPLLAVHTVADALINEPASVQLGEARVSRQLETLRTCSTMMEGIVSDMLDFERIDSGRMVLVHRPFSVGRLLKDAEVAFAQLCARKGVRLEFEPLSEELRRARYIGDSRRLLQCLCNGLSNANKFTDPGGRIVVRAWLTPHASDDWSRVHVSVVDDGVGLDRSELHKLSQGGAFAQVGRGQLQGNGGTGLGLTIVRHILKLHHNSELALYSAGHSKGTTFEMMISMPLASSADEAAGRSISLSPPLRSRLGTASGSLPHSGPAPSTLPPPRPGGLNSLSHALARASPLRPRRGPSSDNAPASPSSASSSAHNSSTAARGRGSGLVARLSPMVRRSASTASAERASTSVLETDVSSLPAVDEPALRCLHVEDDMMLQLSVQARLFTRNALECDTACNGREAVEMVARRAAEGSAPYALVLMDNQMPMMSGAEATRRLRADGFVGHIIGMTGDPAGTTDRDEFEAAGLDECVDKTPEGLDVVERFLRTHVLGQGGGRSRLASE